MTLKKLDRFTKKVSDLPDKPNTQMNAAEVKKYFDTPADEVRIALNQLIDDLKLPTAGDSGALNVGVSTITGVDGATVQAVLESLKAITDTKTSKTGNHEGTWQGLHPRNFEGGQQAIDLQGHINDNVAHITQAERTAWNGARGYTDTAPEAMQMNMDRFQKIRSGKVDGVYTIVEYKRADNTLYAKSVLSGGTSPNYTTRTITYYGANGTTEVKRVTKTLSYDADGDLVQEV